MSGNDTAALVVALSAQLTKFEKDMDSAAGIADKGARRIEDRFAKINPGTQFIDAFSSKLLALGSAAGLAELISKMADLNEQVANLGEHAGILGTSTDAFQTFRYAVVAAGGSIDQADRFLDIFSRKVGEAATGTGTLYNFLKANNIAISEFVKLPLTTQIEKYGSLLKNVAEPQNRMNDLFMVGGRQAGPSLISALTSLSGGFQKIGDDAGKAGAILDHDFIERAQKSATEWRKLKLEFSVTSEELAVSTWELLSRSVSSVASAIGDMLEKLDQLRKQNMGAATGIPIGEVAGVGFVPGMAPELGPPGVKLTVQPTVPVPLPQSRPGSGDLGGDGTTKQYNAQAEAVQKLIKAQEDRIKLLQAEDQVVGKSIYDATYLTEKIKLEAEARKANNDQPLSKGQLAAIDKEAQAIAGATAALDAHKRAWAGLNSAIQFAGDQGIDVMDGLRNKTLTTADAVKQLENAFIHAAEQAVFLGSGPLAGIFGTQSNVAGGTGGLLGVLAGLIPKFASGTDSAPGGLSLVGENGPEIMNVPRGSQIMPNSVASKLGGGAIIVQVTNAPVFQAGMTPTDIASISAMMQVNNQQLTQQIQNGLRANIRNDQDYLTR